MKLALDTQRAHVHLLARLACLMLALVAGGVARAESGSVSLQYRKVMNFDVKFVAVNMHDPDVVIAPAVAQRFPTGLESWGSFINRLQPDAAINGTYFCLRSYMPVGDIAVEGNLIYSGVVGTALCITPDNRVEMRPGPFQAKPDWSGFRTVLCAGPRLLTDGKVTVDARAEGFRDPHVLGSAPRSAVAWRPDGLLLFLTIEQNISLQNLAYVCLHLGAVDAMALDGGSSSGLYAYGRTVTRPGRGLSNILAIYSSRQRFQAFAKELVPANVPLPARLLPDDTTFALQPPQLTAPQPEAQPAQPLNPGLVRITKPDPSQPVQGTVPITIEVTPDKHIGWTTLRINGVLRAMGNVWPLEYDWDSTKEQDGRYTLEVTAWSETRSLLARDVCVVQVNNARQVAQR